MKNADLPPSCDTEIFQNGEGVCLVDGGRWQVENWVKEIAKKANARVDWHYSGGVANILHLGDDASRQRVLDAINELAPSLEGDIMRIGGPALPRNGVNNT